MASDTSVKETSWVDTPPRSPLVRRLNAQFLNNMPWLDKVSSPLQQWVSKLYGSPDQGTYRIKDFLNGVWLGHVLHPVLVNIPLGSWTATTFFDLAWLNNPSEANAQAADATLWIGMAGAVGSAVTGLTNWVDTDGPDQRTGMLHGLINGSVTALNLTSGILRLTGQRKTAVALASLAYAASLYSAYLGGELSYSSGVNVNHVAWEGGSDDFLPVLSELELPDKTLKRVNAGGMPAVLYKENGKIFAIAATCSHLGGPLDEGTCENGVVHCPWHNSGFRLTDGSVANSPAVYGQPTFAVQVHEGQIYLRRLEHA